MDIKKTKFLISSPNLELCPESLLPEFALIGRSNVGKSSFINKLANNSRLAKTSNTPGKTRLINLFDFNGEFLFADLPGYGYAKISKEEQNRWQKALEEYLLKRKNLKAVFHFIDARHDIQKNDYQMYEWLKFHKIKAVNILAKCDYVSKIEISKKIGKLEQEFGNYVFPFSTKSNFYQKNILDFLNRNIF